MTCSAKKTEVLHLAHFGADGTAKRGMLCVLIRGLAVICGGRVDGVAECTIGCVSVRPICLEYC